MQRSESTRRRYTEAERARILAAAERGGFSGPKAAKRFGISTLTFYTWRKKTTRARVREAGRRQVDGSLASLIRAGVHARVRELLPGIVREEVAQALSVKGGRR
jgi:transposase-like protein